MSDLSSYVRVAHGVNKKLLFAVVDDENDITYYNCGMDKTLTPKYKR